MKMASFWSGVNLTLGSDSWSYFANVCKMLVSQPSPQKTRYFAGCYIQIGFIQGQGLDEIGVPLKDRPDGARHRLVPRKVRWPKDGLRAPAFCRDRRHRGPDTIAPSLVGSRANHGSPSLPGHDDRLAAQCRIIPLFDRSIKRVYVHMNDLACPPVNLYLLF